MLGVIFSTKIKIMILYRYRYRFHMSICILVVSIIGNGFDCIYFSILDFKFEIKIFIKSKFIIVMVI